MNTRILFVAEHVSYFQTIALRSLPLRYRHLYEDLAQDAIVKCIDKIDLYDESKGNLKSWIYRVTQNLCFDAVKKMDRMKITPLTFDIVQDEEHRTIDSIEKAKIRKAIRLLPKKDRKLIMLKNYFNYSGKEISEALDIPESQVAVYYRRAKMKLKRCYLNVA